MKEDQKMKGQNSRVNIMLLKNRHNVQKSETDDFQMLVKKLSNNLAGLLKGMVLSKMNNKKLKKDLQEVTNLKSQRNIKRSSN